MRILSAFLKRTLYTNVFPILIIACLFLMLFYGSQETKTNNFKSESLYIDSVDEIIDPKFHTDLVTLYYQRRKVSFFI